MDGVSGWSRPEARAPALYLYLEPGTAGLGRHCKSLPFSECKLIVCRLWNALIPDDSTVTVKRETGKTCAIRMRFVGLT